MANTLSPGDRVLMFETGHFATLWRAMAGRLGLEVEFVPGDWRHGADPALVEEKLAADRAHQIKAVCVVHNETSTGVMSRIAEIRAAIDDARHPALFMVDTISSLASIDYRHDEWRVDVTVAGSQKGLMLPPGLGFNAVSKKALAAAEDCKTGALLLGLAGDARNRRDRLFPLYARDQFAVRAARGVAHAAGGGGLARRLSPPRPPCRGDQARGRRLGPRSAVRRPARAFEFLDRGPGPRRFDADRLREIILDGFDMSLGTGLGRLKGKVFRIGHLGWFNDLMLCGTLERGRDGTAPRRHPAPRRRRRRSARIPRRRLANRLIVRRFFGAAIVALDQRPTAVRPEISGFYAVRRLQHLAQHAVMRLTDRGLNNDQGCAFISAVGTTDAISLRKLLYSVAAASK